MMVVQSDIPDEFEVEAHSENDAELLSQECRNRGGTEPIRRLNKLRSIKLSKVRSFRQSRSSVNSRSDRVSSILYGNQATPQKLSPIPMLDASPNYMKATSCSSARKENFHASPLISESSFGSVDSNFFGNSNHLKPNAAFLGQKSARALARRSTFKPMKGLTRMSSLRSQRPSMKKYSGGAEMKRKLKKSRSIKLAGFDSLRLPTGKAKNPYDRPSIASSAISSDPSKAHCQASPRNSESGFSSNGHRKNWIVLNPNSDCGQKSLMRKSSLRRVRILTKMSSLKPRRPKQDRATCSSTLKNSKFPHHVELHPGGFESERTSVMKVCPYKYCSLNGHCHAPLPPLKPFLLRRRRQLKTQKTMKKRFSDLEKEIQAYKMAFILDSTAEKSGEDFFVEIYDKPKNKSTGDDGTHGGDDEAKGESGSQLSDFQAVNCSIKRGSDGSVSVVTDNESYNSNVIGDQPDSVVFCSLEGEGPELCNEQSSTLDEPESTSHEEVAASGNVRVHDEFVSVLNSEFNEGGSESHGEKADDLTIAAGEPSCPSKSPGPYDHAQSTTLNGVVSSAPDCGPFEKLTEGSEEKKHGVFEPDDCGFLLGCSPAGDSELPCNTDEEAIESQLEKQKFIRMWRLIYQHVVSAPAAKIGGAKVSLDGAEGEKQQDDADSLVNTDACQEDNGANCQKIGLRQIDAVRLVEEAIDGILLPETPDNSSDVRFLTSDKISDQEFSDGKDKEGSILASCSSAKQGFGELSKIQSTVADPEQTLLKDDNATVQVHDKTISKGEDKPGKEMRKSWSNLKKVILLKKFIKAVEKARKFNPREPRYLPLEPKSEAEKVYLRHQEMYGRKSAEEWMLDYALQQVVSKLTPARRRKVTLLVEAFEAISPLQDIESPLKPTQAIPFHAKPDRRLRESAEQTGDSLTVAENIPVVSPDPQETKQDCFCPGTELDKSVSVAADADEKEEEIAASSLNNGEGNSTITADLPDFDGSCLPVIKDSGLCGEFSSKTGDNGSTCCKEVQVDIEILQEVHQEIISSLKSEPCNGNSEENGKNLEIGNLTDDLAGTGNSSTKEDSSDSMGNEKVNEKLDPDNGYLQRNPSSGASEPESNGSTAYGTKMDKQRRNSMWFLIYQHMVSDIRENVEIRPLIDEANKTLPQGVFETDRRKGTENHDACCEDTELRQSDAIKLVQEAIDRMLSPQIQDHSLDNSSNTEEDGSRGADRIKVNGKTEDAEEGKTESKVGGNKSNHPVVSKNWGHLKKLILLKRFVKSLEKVKKFNPRGPRFLALEPDPEAEKVCLRHQTTEDRKNSEEWMLDRALQQVVTKLSPARRRRVELLVEAFETVTPPSHSQIEARKRRCTASKGH